MFLDFISTLGVNERLQIVNRQRYNACWDTKTSDIFIDSVANYIQEAKLSDRAVERLLKILLYKYKGIHLDKQLCGEHTNIIATRVRRHPEGEQLLY